MPRILIYILVMAVVTYLIRMLPIVLFRKEIKNKTIRSFLYYVPYVTLSVMTFPAIISSTDNMISGIAGFIVASFLAFKGKSLLFVASGASVTVLICELIIRFV